MEKGKDAKEALSAYLKELHLPAFRSSYEELAQQARQESLGYEQYLLGLAQRECQERRNKRVERLLHESRLPLEKSWPALDLKRLPPRVVQQARALRTQGVLFSLEPLIDYRAWTNREEIVALLPQVDLVTPDWPSASGIAGSTEPRHVVDYWARLGPRVVAIRHGHHGSYVWDGDHDRCWHIPAVPVPVVDPTGAGNSYGGGLCAGWIATGEASAAGTCGAVAASFMVERVGLPALSERLQATARDQLKAALPAASPFP